MTPTGSLSFFPFSLSPEKKESIASFLSHRLSACGTASPRRTQNFPSFFPQIVEGNDVLPLPSDLLVCDSIDGELSPSFPSRHRRMFLGARSFRFFSLFLFCRVSASPVVGLELRVTSPPFFPPVSRFASTCPVATWGGRLRDFFPFSFFSRASSGKNVRLFFTVSSSHLRLGFNIFLPPRATALPLFWPSFEA